MSTFISYSRVNSAFVVRLARDLKSAGFDVWLDQLDIPKGSRWDDEIEAAVERSSTFMIVLAPESMESQNVKDELSYAIDSGKYILPVVIKPCKIPLRLRRFQYVDFTDNPYKDSLAEIKRILSNTQQIIKAAAFVPPEEDIEPEEQDELDEPAETMTSIKEALFPSETVHGPEARKIDTDPTGSQSRKYMVPLLLVFGMGLAATTAAFAFFANREASPPPVRQTSTFFTNAPADTPLPTVTPPPVFLIDGQGVTMRLVAAGEFIMGSANGLEDEKPVATLYLDNFYIDKYEVTNALYRSCVEAGICPAPKKTGPAAHAGYYAGQEFDNHPVVYVDWEMAQAYCGWRSARLPTEAEWEKAARGTDGRTYPWGENISCDEANYFGCVGETTPVTSYNQGLSIYGVHNLAGNVSEWVSSLYVEYPYNPSDGREDPDALGERVVRGGSWISSDRDNEARSARRQKADPATAANNIGFRCVHVTGVSVMVNTLQTITPPSGSILAAQATTSRPNVNSSSSQAGTTDGLVNATLTFTPSRLPGITPKTPTDTPTRPPVAPPTESPTEPPTEPPVYP